LQSAKHLNYLKFCQKC